MLCAKSGWFAHWFCRYFFRFCHLVFYISFYLNSEKGGDCIWTNFNSLHPKMRNVKYGKILGRIFTISSLYSIEKCVALYLKKLESQLPKNALYQVWSKIGQLVLEKKILKCCQWFFDISLIYQLEKERTLHFNILELNWCFVPNLVEIGQVVLEKKIMMERV